MSFSKSLLLFYRGFGFIFKPLKGLEPEEHRSWHTRRGGLISNEQARQEDIQGCTQAWYKNNFCQKVNSTHNKNLIGLTFSSGKGNLLFDMW